MSVRVTGVSELVLEVTDLEAAERFYAGALGLPVVERYASGETIWLMAGEQTRIGLWLPQLGVAGGRGGAHVHFALQIGDHDFDAALARLREWDLEPQIEHRRRHRRTASRSAYVFDPDGNCVELWTQDMPAYVQRVAGQLSVTREPRPAAGTARDAWWNQPTVRAHLSQTRLEATVQLAGAGPGSLLDVLTGSGRLLAALADRGWTVAGIDPRPHLIELARARIPAAAERLTVDRAETLQYPDDSFDVVVAAGVLEQADLETSVKELSRVLRRNGRVVIGLRNGRAPAVAWRTAVVHPLARAAKRVVPVGRRPPKSVGHPPSTHRVQSLFAAAGLVVEHVEPVSCEVLLDPLDRLVPRLAFRAARRAEASAMLRRLLGTHLLVLAVKR